MEKKHWILIGVLIAVVIVWYFFLRKKKTESNYDRNKFFRVKQDLLRAYSCGPGEWACGYTSSGVKCCPRGTGGGPTVNFAKTTPPKKPFVVLPGPAQGGHYETA